MIIFLFTCAAFAIEAHGESEVGGELNLLGIHGDCHTVSRAERSRHALSVHLEEKKHLSQWL